MTFNNHTRAESCLLWIYERPAQWRLGLQAVAGHAAREYLQLTIHGFNVAAQGGVGASLYDVACVTIKRCITQSKLERLQSCLQINPPHSTPC